MLFDNVSELKRYWNKHIFPLPHIIKNQLSKIVDPVLFLQLFFVGQDKKDTSNISHAGFYNKADFYNMLSGLLTSLILLYAYHDLYVEDSSYKSIFPPSFHTTLTITAVPMPTQSVDRPDPP